MPLLQREKRQRCLKIKRLRQLANRGGETAAGLFKGKLDLGRPRECVHTHTHTEPFINSHAVWFFCDVTSLTSLSHTGEESASVCVSLCGG